MAETKTNLSMRVAQIISIVLFAGLAYFFLKEGIGLIYSGATGEWNILMELTGWKLYITSVVPGLFVVFGGVAIVIWALPRVMKGLK